MAQVMGRTLRDAQGDELRALLGPIAPATFVHEYWAKKPLFVKGFPDKYVGFFDAAAFSRVLAAPGPVGPDFLRVSFDRKTEAGTSADALTPGELRSSAFRATPDQAVPLFDAGATLCVSQVETRATELAPFVAAIKRQLGYTGKVTFNGYLSPPGSGYNWHFDSRIATTLQIEGTKTWRYTSRPAIAWPRGNGSLRGDGTAHYADPTVTRLPWEELTPVDFSDVTEVVLEPGDLLVLPAGTWHEACGGSGGSLALNLSFTPVSYTALLRTILDALLLPEAGWRAPEPLLPAGAPGEADPAGIAAISAQLARAAETLRALSGDSAAVARAWSSFVQNPNPGLPAPPTPPVHAAPVEPDQRLRVRADGNFHALLADHGTLLAIVIGASREIELSGAAVGFVQRIIAEREFVARSCTTWNDASEPFAWDDVQFMLTNLMREGLIGPA